jgi:uncharacterized metal-binding protein
MFVIGDRVHLIITTLEDMDDRDVAMKMIGKEIINIVITEQIDTNAMIILIALVGLTIELKIRSKHIVLDVLTNHHKKKLKRAKSKAKAMKF